MSTTIYVSQGKVRYVGGTIVELTGKDISGATFTVAVGTSSTVPPTTGWAAPDVSQAGPGFPMPNQYGITIPSTATRLVLKKIQTGQTIGGPFWVWGNVQDNPEIEPMVLDGPFYTA